MDNFGYTYHLDAYTTHIFNVLDLAPLDLSNVSIYGHHGLFFFLPLKILTALGFDPWTGCALIISLVGFVTFICQYYCLSVLIRNNLLYYLAVLACSVISFQIYYNQYFQLMPHRLLFPALTLLLCRLSFLSPSKRIRTTGWVVVALAMLWNLETGLVCGIAYLIADFYLLFAKASQLKRIILQPLLGLVLGFFAGYIICNLYNQSVGGSYLFLLDYIYPLGSDQFNIGELQLSLMQPDNLYFLTIAIFLGSLTTLSGLFIYNRLSVEQYYIFLTCIIGLGTFSFYVNRAVNTNLVICYYPLVSVLAYLCDIFLPVYSSTRLISTFSLQLYKTIKLENILFVLCLLVLSAMALASLSTFGYTLMNKYNTTWNVSGLQNFVGQVNEILPSDTVAVGYYTPQLFLIHASKSVCFPN